MINMFLFFSFSSVFSRTKQKIEPHFGIADESESPRHKKTKQKIANSEIYKKKEKIEREREREIERGLERALTFDCKTNR